MKEDTKRLMCSIVFVLVLVGVSYFILEHTEGGKGLRRGMDLSYEYSSLDNECDKAKFLLDHKEEVYMDKVIDAKEYFESYCLTDGDLEYE